MTGTTGPCSRSQIRSPDQSIEPAPTGTPIGGTNRANGSANGSPNGSANGSANGRANGGPDAAAGLIQLARRISGPPPGPNAVVEALTIVCALVPGATCASLTRFAEKNSSRNSSRKSSRNSSWWRTVAATGAAAAALDALQDETGEGPGLTAITTITTITSDFTAETRWPAFIGRALAGSEVRSAVSYPLGPAGHPGITLNLYATSPTAFQPAAFQAAASQAAVDVFDQSIELAAAGLALALAAITHADRADHLTTALVSNRTIAAAQGILMHRYRWTPEQALTALRSASQRGNRKMRHIAEGVLVTGDLPVPQPQERAIQIPYL